MIDGDHGLSIIKRPKALGIGRVHCLSRPVSPADLAVVRRIDELHRAFPFAGGRMPRDLLNREGIAIGRRHVATPMKRMRIEALYRKPNTSKASPGHKIDPRLPRGVTADRPDRAWAMDIFNTDEGARPTRQEFTAVRLGAGVAISMDGKGAWRENVFVERLWRSIKFREIDLRADDPVGEARASIGRPPDPLRRPQAAFEP